MNDFGAVRQWMRNYHTYLLTFGIFLTWVLFTVHKVAPDYIPHILALSVDQAIVVSMFLFIAEFLVKLDIKIEHVISGASAGVLVGRDHDEGNRQLIKMLGSFPEQSLDLLQFSGYAGAALMRDVAQKYPGTTIRLLIASNTVTDYYDKPPFHEQNVLATYQNLKVIYQQQPNVTFAVWRYNVHPVISAILVGSRLVSASWYRVYPVPNEERPALRGQDQPTVTATGEAAPPILKMAREQFDSILYHSTTELIVAFGPKAMEVVDSWVSMITGDLSTDQKREMSEKAKGKIRSNPKAGEFLSW